MTDLRDAARQALEALEQSETWVPDEGFGMLRREAERKHEAAITALKAALEQPEQEEYTLVALRLIERLTREADGIAINVRDMLGGIARAAIARAEGKV